MSYTLKQLRHLPSIFSRVSQSIKRIMASISPQPSRLLTDREIDLYRTRSMRDDYHRRWLYEQNVDVNCPRPHDLCQPNFKQPHYPACWCGSGFCDRKSCLILDGDMTLKVANSCCNKTVPIYILGGDSRSLRHQIFEYVFSRWNKPGENDIEWGQFLAKNIMPRGFDIAEGLKAGRIVDDVLTLHRDLCEMIEDRKKKMLDHDTQGGTSWPECARWSCYRLSTLFGFGHSINTERRNADLVQRDQQHYVVQPIFRALAIAVCQGTYRKSLFNDPPGHTGSLPVLLMRTGVTDGLSAPITFDLIAARSRGVFTGDIDDDAVYTTLEAAIELVRMLEKREHAVFGAKPDPVLSTEDHQTHFFEAAHPSEELMKKAYAHQEDLRALAPSGRSSTWLPAEVYANVKSERLKDGQWEYRHVSGGAIGVSDSDKAKEYYEQQWFKEGKLVEARVSKELMSRRKRGISDPKFITETVPRWIEAFGLTECDEI